MKKIVINKQLVLNEIQRLFGPCDVTEATIENVLKISHFQKIKKHELFLKPGDVNDYVAIVLKGLVQSYHYEGNKLVTDFFSSEGYAFFDTNSFVKGEPTNSYFEALEPTVIAKFERKNFFDAGISDPAIDNFYRKILQHEITLADQRLNSILHDSAEEKYENLERKVPGITSRVSAINIASFLGVTQETLCRVKAKRGDLF